LQDEQARKIPGLTIAAWYILESFHYYIKLSTHLLLGDNAVLDIADENC
jgi:hypothetical protein